MTLLEMLKQLLGSRAEEEIDATLGSGIEEKEDEAEEKPADKEEEDEAEEKPADKEEEEVLDTDGGDSMLMFEDGWFNSETGDVDESKIKNAEALAAVQAITGRYKKEKEDRQIADSLNDELKNYSLAVSEDTLRKVIDMTNVSINKEGKVVGVKEALEALKTNEPGFFKDKDKENNPLNEGFNPVEKKNLDNITSFSQAFKLMEEIE